MRRALRIVSLAAVAAVLAVLGKIAWLSHDRGPDIHQPVGYELIARLFLVHGWLAFDEETTQIVLPPEQPKGAPHGIYRRSFLHRDVEAYNDGNRAVFRIENQVIRSVDVTRHNVVLPYGEVDRWRGALRFRPSSTLEASLRGIGVDIQLTGLSRELLGHKAPDLTLRGDRRAEPLLRARDEVVNLYGAPGVFLGKVYLAGDKVVLNNRNYPSAVSMSVSGERIPQGNRGWVGPGDVLKLTWRTGPLGRSRYALLWSEGGQSADFLSVPCAINGGWSRCPERPSLPLATDVISTLDAGVAGRRAGTPNSFDVVLTLDRELSAKVQRALEESRDRSIATGGGETADRRRAARAAVTVMDALNGEILALASYPTETALAHVDLPAGAETRLLRNHNFSRMPIGSVAKVLFGAAIVDADPRLLSLRLQQHDGDAVDSIAGIHVEPPIESHPVGTDQDGRVDFHRFIAHSSNEYAAVLLTLACATEAGASLPAFTGDPLANEGQYSIAGRQYDRGPAPGVAGETRLKLVRRSDGLVVGGTQSTLEGEPWADSFMRLFDVDKVISRPIDRRDPALGDAVIDTAIWGPVLDQLYGQRVPENHPFRAVGLERENLSLNLSHVYRTQLLSLMYGGAAARFTNPKLCEMFSRLVTGRRVEQSLVLGVAPFGDHPPPVRRRPQALGLDEGVRSALLQAMASVARSGTAGDLYPVLTRIDRALAARGQALGFFSKTGSPRNTISVPSGLARAVNALVATRAIALNGDGALTYRGIVVAEDLEGAQEAPSLAALRNSARDRAILARYGVGPRLVHNALVLYNVETAATRGRLFVVEDQRLIGMNLVRQIPATGAVYVFTMGVYPGAARRSAAPLDIDAVHYQPLRAYSVAINIEGQGKSTEAAVPFAASLIEQVLWPALEQQR